MRRKKTKIAPAPSKLRPATLERMAQVVELRTAGLSQAEIGERLGLHQCTVSGLLTQATKRAAWTAQQQARDAELARIETLYAAVEALLASFIPATHGGEVVMVPLFDAAGTLLAPMPADGKLVDAAGEPVLVALKDHELYLACVDRLQKLGEQRRKLLALDLPKVEQIEVKRTGLESLSGFTPAQLDAAIAQGIERIRQMSQPAPPPRVERDMGVIDATPVVKEAA